MPKEHKKKKKSDKEKDRSHKKSRRDRSPSSDSSFKLLKILEDKKVEEMLERKKQKEQNKIDETPEEKRTRRLSEKKVKEQKRKERMGWDTEYQHYTDQDNPFGDGQLTSTFIWSKKLEKQGIKSISSAEIEMQNKRKQMENRVELEKVKKRRQEREVERMLREEETCLMQRSKETAQFEEWERQEDHFHLDQARLRSKIRIQDGRAKPIDLLAQYVSDQNLDETMEMQMHEPYTYLNGLSVKDLEDLLVDIKVYIQLEKDKNIQYWEDLTVIVQNELKKLTSKTYDADDYKFLVTRREGIHQSVTKDITEVFRGKTTVQLNDLKYKIENKLTYNSGGIDIGYWESLLSQLKAYMAQARLKDKHQEILRQKLEILKGEQSESAKYENTTSNMDDASDNSQEPGTSKGGVDYGGDEKDFKPTGLDLSECCIMYERGNYSPEYIDPSRIDDIDLAPIDAEDDLISIEIKRNHILDVKFDVNQGANDVDSRMRKEARQGMGGDEAEFAVEAKLEANVYLWSDKYRPRKPRYFNRVHTGFEWNKYNQTHYDMDNPPPKIVQGYKFNIFYPDLIDKNCTPQYHLITCPDNKDFATLKFQSGPPYEDIAFKIVNREWEFSYKRGFRCQFHNNIFQLWFHFKRYRYRR